MMPNYNLRTKLPPFKKFLSFIFKTTPFIRNIWSRNVNIIQKGCNTVPPVEMKSLWSIKKHTRRDNM